MLMIKKNESVSIFNEWVRWGRLGWFDILSRYRRTIFGPFWIVLMTLITIGSIGFVYGAIFKVSIRDFIPHVAIGIITWTWMSTSLIESCTSFTTYKFIMVNQVVQPTSIIIRVMYRNLIILLHNLSIVVMLFFFFKIPISWSALLILFSLPLVGLVIFSLGIILAYFCSRFHDFIQLTTSLMSLMFIVTPIIWSPKILEERTYIAYLNPFSYLIDIVRLPLLGEIPERGSWLVVTTIFLIVGVGAWATNHNFQRRVLFWL